MPRQFPSTLSQLSPSHSLQPPDRTCPSWDTSFFSACELESCLQGLGKAYRVVQLSAGPLSGRFSVVHLHGTSVLMISTNQVLLLNGDRGRDFISFCLEISGNNVDHRVQCQTFDPLSIYGFNQELTEAHVQLSAGSISLFAFSSAKHFRTFLSRAWQEQLIEQLHISNAIQVSAQTHSSLANHLGQILCHPPADLHHSKLMAENLRMQLLTCLLSQDHQFKPFELAPRERLVQELVSWGLNNSNNPKNLDEICTELFTSRRTLILGSKDNFKRGPMELLRTIRLQQVHALLRSPQARQDAGLHQVHDVAAHFGFRSRGHFAKAYQDHFDEAPRTTLIRSAA